MMAIISNIGSRIVGCRPILLSSVFQKSRMKRNFSSSSLYKSCCKTNKKTHSVESHRLSKSIIEVHGRDVHSFLQGLVTNDVNLLKNPSCSILYTYMLNSQVIVIAG